MDVTKIECFEYVACVLGEERAKLELQKVWDNRLNCLWYGHWHHTIAKEMAENMFSSRSLGDAFKWENTPQGYDFWLMVSRAAEGMTTVKEFEKYYGNKEK